MTRTTAELVMILITLVAGAGSWYLWDAQKRWLSALLFVVGVALCAVIADHWNIKVNSF